MSQFQDDCIARLNEQVKQDQIIIKKLSDQRDELVTALAKLAKIGASGVIGKPTWYALHEVKTIARAAIEGAFGVR